EVRFEGESLRVYPRPETLRALLRPVETQVFTGNQVARTKGEGSEFADHRRFVPGDRIRRINWRASARRNELRGNERHAERNAVGDFAWQGADLLPPRVLPPQALVLALSPLADERSGRALLDLRARGFDLAVIQVSSYTEALAGTNETDRLAFRIWGLRRAAM